jgi:hypothetical protein
MGAITQPSEETSHTLENGQSYVWNLALPEFSLLWFNCQCGIAANILALAGSFLSTL